MFGWSRVSQCNLKINYYFSCILLRYSLNNNSCVLSILIIQTFIAGRPNLRLTFQLKFYDKHNYHFTYFSGSETDVGWKWNFRSKLFSHRNQRNDNFNWSNIQNTCINLPVNVRWRGWRLIKRNSFGVEKH